MGITIDESMKVLQEIPKVMPITKEAINVALETMRKYQKIKECISVPNKYGMMAEDCQKLEYIRKVVENGNDK